MAGRLREPDAPGDDGPVDAVPEVPANLVGDLAAELRATVVHREHSALDLEPRIQMVRDQANRREQLAEPLEGEVLALDGYQRRVGCGQRIEREQAERGRAVDQDVVELTSNRVEQAAEATLPLLDRRELHLGTGEGDRRGNEGQPFDLGVDDILTVPFSPEELLARVVVIMRRTYGAHVPLQPVLKLGDLEMDILNRRVRVGDDDLHLTGLEQSLLYLLAANAGRLISRDEIMDTLWGVDFAAGSNVVDQHIRSLRSKLQNDWRKPRFIATVPGKGYRFIPTFT
jgi:DNA-binding winged helix-turn-helix (wHTH) protein